MDILNERATAPLSRIEGDALPLASPRQRASDVYDRDTGRPLGRFVGHAGRAVIIAPANGSQIVRRASSVYLEEVRT